MQNKISWANCLKGILCLAVFTSHFLLAFYPASYGGDITLSHNAVDVLLAKEPFAILFNGRYCVYLFLTIGAYVFADKLLKSSNSKKEGYSLFKRYFRFAIPLFVVCLITLLIYKLKLFTNIECSKITKSWWLETLYANELNLYNLFTNPFFLIPFVGESTYSTAFWMLNYSFFGTYLVYILAVIFRNKKINIIFITLPLFWLFINSSIYLSFVLGFLVAYIDNNFELNIFDNKWLCFLFVVVGFIFGSIPISAASRFELVNQLLKSPLAYKIEIKKTCYEISSFLIIFGLCKLFNNDDKSNMKLLNKIGDISFSIYLIHIALICSISSTLFMALYRICSNYDIAVFITYIISLIVLIVLSTLFDILIEKNSNKLIDRIVSIFNTRRE